MKNLLFVLATFFLLISCEKYDKSEIYFAEYHLKNNTDYYVTVRTDYLTTLGIYKEDYNNYQGLSLNSYPEKPTIVGTDTIIYATEVIQLPNPAQWETYTNRLDTIAPNSTSIIRIPIWDNHYYKLPPYDSIEQVVVINPNTNKVSYKGKGYYCESITDTQISPYINIRFIGSFCTGEYNNGKFVLIPSSKEISTQEFLEKLSPNFIKAINFN